MLGGDIGPQAPLKGHGPTLNIVFSLLWPTACFKLTLLSWGNCTKPSLKVIEAKKYELNRQNNG